MSAPEKASLALPSMVENLKKSPQIQKLNAGSATGNPRNKCALKPGHSLMDWIRLGNSGVDLSGTKGAIIPVNHSELSKHCTQTDAWMAIRGKVYNITRYMDFHPGGPEELMRGAGKDATKLFDEVHAWVNYEQLLKKCFIGPLRKVVKIDVDFLKPANLNLAPPEKLKVPTPKTISTEVIPRFDWIQKRSDLSLYFYTRQFCNPGLILTKNTEKNVSLKLFIENKCHLYDFELLNEVNWPPVAVKISSESGKVELIFQKTRVEVWSDYGTMAASSDQRLEDYRFEFEIKDNTKFNHNSFSLVLRGKRDVIFCLPIGYHVTISSCIEGQEVSRSYTPVPRKYSLVANGDPQDLHFLLKTYADGLLAKHISGLRIGSELELSQPKGSLRLNKFLGHTRIALLAAGSGITPLFALTDHLLARNSNRVEKIVLMFFNRNEEDIWCRTLLEDVAKSDARFHLTHILSQHGDDWKGEKGHINKDLLSSITDKSLSTYCTFICVCGPPIFNNLAETILKTLDFPSEAIQLFNG